MVRSSRKQVGIIGVGRIGRCHCASVASVPGKATVSMICDIYQPALDQVSAMYHVPKTTTDPMEVRLTARVFYCIFIRADVCTSRSKEGVV